MKGDKVIDCAEANKKDFEYFRQFENTKVKVVSANGKEFEGTIKQEIINEPTGFYMLLPKGCRNKGYHLSLWRDGWFATILVKEVVIK